LPVPADVKCSHTPLLELDEDADDDSLDRDDTLLTDDSLLADDPPEDEDDSDEPPLDGDDSDDPPLEDELDKDERLERLESELRELAEERLREKDDLLDDWLLAELAEDSDDDSSSSSGRTAIVFAHQLTVVTIVNTPGSSEAAAFSRAAIAMPVPAALSQWSVICDSE
jgi:hypothetical protein